MRLPLHHALTGHVWPGAGLLSSARLSYDPAAPRPARAGGHIVLSHPLGRSWHTRFRRDAPQLAPNGLPDAAGLAALAAGLPLTVRSLADEEALYLALLQARRGLALSTPTRPALSRGRGAGDRGRRGVPCLAPCAGGARRLLEAAGLAAPSKVGSSSGQGTLPFGAWAAHHRACAETLGWLVTHPAMGFRAFIGR